MLTMDDVLTFDVLTQTGWKRLVMSRRQVEVMLAELNLSLERR